MTTTTQRLKPTQSSSIVSSSDHRPTVVLCSSKDEHLLSQDICNLCGSLGKADEGNLISCSQCGQCYHPYCVSIKGLKVVVSKGWRCLECTVCETCGQPGDEAKLLLCDECELSCHTYCLDPPLEDVPQGAWKCHWCVVCQRCGSHSSGVKSDWQKNYTECGPCSSRNTCPKCKTDYTSNNLIIQCIHCSRWLHARCDSIRDEEECELASELGYTCLLCRPKDDIPLYIVHRNSIDSTSQSSNKVNPLPSTITNLSQVTKDDPQDHDIIEQPRQKTSLLTVATSSNNDSSLKFMPSVNKISLNSNLTRNLQADFPRPQSAPLSSSNENNNPDSIKRPASSLHFTSTDIKGPIVNGTDDSIIQDDHNLTDGDENAMNKSSNKVNDDDLYQGMHLVDGVYLSDTGFNFVKSQKLEPAKRQRAKRGAKVQKSDDCNPDDINRDDDEENKLISDDKVDEDGRKKRVRKLSKVGIGGFTVRQRGVRINKDDDFNYSLSNDVADVLTPPPVQTQNQRSNLDRTNNTLLTPGIKPKRIRKKPKKKANLIDQYPSYLQEAFFGKDLLLNNESKSTEEKCSETLNDCSNMDLQLEDNDNLKSQMDSDSTSRMNAPNKLKTSVKLSDSMNDFMNDLNESTKLNDMRQSSKEDDLMDVFVTDVQTVNDPSEPKKDAFDPDLLSTDFNLEMVAIDSKVVEDLLNDLGTQPGTQKLPQAPEPYNPATIPQNVPTTSTNMNIHNNNHPNIHPHIHQHPQAHPHQHPHQHPHHHHPHQQSQHHLNTQQPMHQHVQPQPGSMMPSQGTIHHIQPQPQNQMISTSMSPHQVAPMHQQHQISPNTVQHPQHHQIPTNSHHITYEVRGVRMHPSKVNSMNQINQCNSDPTNPIVVNAPSPTVTLSSRAKVSSPCMSNTHRPSPNASFTGPMPSPAQQQIHHPLPPPNQSNQHTLSPMIEQEPGNSLYQMPQSPWTNSQPDPNRQYSSPHLMNDPNWQSQSGAQDDSLSQSKKNSQNWESEEALGDKATKSAVLYANLEHPSLKHEYRTSDERFKQIQKLWRQLPPEKRKPYVEKARENRSASKVSTKPVAEAINVPKKAGPPLQQQQQSQLQHQTKPQMSHEGMHMQQQQVHPNQPPIVHQQQQQALTLQPPQQQQQPPPSQQDTRWKQPMPIEGQHQQTRFLPSPQSHRPQPHVGHDPNVVCPPPDVISPSLRTLSDSGSHYDQSPQQMISPQTSSPHPQFSRPPPQQHSMIQVSRVRPPSIDPSRMLNSEPYAMPPNTPRPMPMQQRSPFSPQSPFPPHPVNAASSTPPVTPRTPNDHQVMYPPNQHVPMNQNQTSQQPGFADSQLQPHMQQANQYQPALRQPQYPNQQRMVGPMHPQQQPQAQSQPQQQQQYGNHMPSQGPMVRGPMDQQIRPQMHPQQAAYPQQSQYRQAQPARYANQHQDIHPHVSSPMQPNQQQQQIHQQRIQSPVMGRQMPQMGVQHQAQRAINQPRIQHPMAPGPAPLHQMQQQQQLPHSPMPQQPQQQPLHQPQQQVQQPHQLPIQHHLQQNPQQPQQPQQQPQTQPPAQPQPQPQQQTAPQLQSQQASQIHYNSLQNNNRIEPEDAAQLLEDDDDLKDLGADFNILEYADPEPDKSASTSAGKNNIELDAELEDYFDERETLDEKRPSDQMMPTGSQQVLQQHQVIYTPMQQQSQQSLQMQQNQNFIDNQPHMGVSHQQQPPHPQQQHQQPIPHPQQQLQQQPNLVQQNQYSPQRQPHYINHQRVITPGNQPQQYMHNHQQQMMRPQQSCVQVRMQHPQHQHPHQQQQPQPQQQQVGYQQHRPQNPRYQNQTHMGHEIHQQHVPHQQMQQPMMNQQQVVNPQQHQRNVQMQPSQPYHTQPGFIDNQQQVQQQPQQVHGGHMHQQQYAQQPQQQQHMIYSNQAQMNVRRQFQPNQQQQHYAYHQQQQQQQGTYQISGNSQQQQMMMKPNNDMMLHDKSPIVGDTMTTMEFTMYEQGSGANNEAVNLPIQTSESSTMPNSNADRALSAGSENTTLLQNQGISFAQPPVRPEQVQQNVHGTENTQRPNDTASNVMTIKQNQESIQSGLTKTDSGYKFVPATSSSGRLSSCSNNNQEIEGNAQTINISQTSGSERVGSGGQPQNQLLKQLLGNCSSADSPNQESSPSLLLEPSKVPIQPAGHSLIPKQVGIPTISFQLDSANKNGSLIGSGQSISGSSQIKGPTLMTSNLQSQHRPNSASTLAPNNFEIKPFSVGQQVPPTVNLNIAPVSVRVQQLPSHLNTNPIVQKRPDAQIISRTEPVLSQHLKSDQQHLNQNQAAPQAVAPKVVAPNVQIAKKIKIHASGDETAAQTAGTGSVTASISLIPTAISETGNNQSAARSNVKATNKRKNDYIAERRAALEKEKTPPPREIKPKKRVRGPNKRSRTSNDDVRPIDSNSNTSEASQLPDGSQPPPPKKRVRKSTKSNKAELASSESMLNSLAIKIHNELPMISVKEPEIRANHNIGAMFACGDLNSKKSKLRGLFGKAIPVAESTVFSNKKGKRKSVGYYHEEFPKDLDDISLEVYNTRLVPRIIDRDCDSPCSIISASSSDLERALSFDHAEISDLKDDEENLTFSGVYTPDLDKYICSRQKLTQDNGHNGNSNTKMDFNNNTRPLSPSLPPEIKLPITYLPVSALDTIDQDNYKENLNENTENHQQQEMECRDISEQTGGTSSLNMRLKDHGNVSVTLTLTNKEADGVKRVLSSLSQLIDYPIASSCVVQSPESLSAHHDERSGLSNSFRLLTGSSQNQLTISPNSHKDLKFNEQNYISVDNAEETNNKVATLTKLESSPIDLKPEFCCLCKAIVVDRGIRKNINEIPEPTILSMQKSAIVKEDQMGELVFCSVHCYAQSIMSSGLKDAMTPPRSLDGDNKNSLYSVKGPQGLPPMSPMMEDDDDEISSHNRLQDAEKSNLAEACPTNAGVEAGRRKRWVDIRYTRWTPTHFDMNKTTSPQSESDDVKEPALTESNPQSMSSQIINHADSSIDSNESDNSTSYSQSTSGKFVNSMDEAFCSDIIVKSERLTASNRYKNSRDSSANKDVITPWPEGLDLIQVRPIKPSAKIKREPGIINQEHDFNQTIDVTEMYQDSRRCVLCHEYGDGDSDGPARLLNLFIDGWVHLNCALWSLDVYELANGALMNVDLACKKAMACSCCHRPGATLKCFKPRCPNYYHFVCATKEQCSFYEDKSVQCKQHSKSAVKEMTSFVVKRRVYVNRDEQKQIAEMIQGEQQNVMRIGSLVFLNIGQLLPHQLMAFHNHNNIFPVGYRIIRYYWSYRRFNKRCKYLCTIEESEGRPQFKIVAQEHGYEDEKFTSDSPQSVWRPIIDMIVNLRKAVPDTITTFPAYIRGEDLFGLTEPSIVRILESLPGVEALTDYDFKFGRSPLLELPLAINPTGCARTEPKLRTHFKRPYTIHTASSVPKSRLQSLSSGDSSSPYIKQFVHSKSSQYRKMKSEWRNNVVLARSRVQGLGLYAARDIEKHTMVIEYIGMLIRNEIAERYERIHEAHNRGIYMFRLDEDRVIDATLAGGLARYINHSCNPNCVAEAVEIDRERKILIIANRKILKGEELGYDYKLAIEDDQHKISCLCGAPTCKKWMN